MTYFKNNILYFDHISKPHVIELFRIQDVYGFPFQGYATFDIKFYSYKINPINLISRNNNV